MKRTDEANSSEQPERRGGRRRVPFWRAWVLLLAGILVLVLVYDTVQVAAPRLTHSDVQAEVARTLASATPPPALASLVYQAVRPSVVLVQTTKDPNQGEPEAGRGTGVVVDQSGSILTALHVVQGAGQIEVTFADGSTSQATIVAQQPENDIAVIRVAQPPDTIVPAVLGDPSTLRVGDDAIVIGNPFGLAGSLTTGAISGLNRTFTDPDNSRTIPNLIQFDAAVNPGNSGGPLLNRNGEVVGIVTALANPTQEKVFIGIGFAVPITTASGALGSAPY